MATKHPQSTRAQVSLWNTTVASRFGMKVRAYKILKALIQLAGVAAGIYAMSLGADPMTTFVIIGTIITGPEFLEYFVANGEANGGGADG